MPKPHTFPTLYNEALQMWYFYAKRMGVPQP